MQVHGRSKIRLSTAEFNCCFRQRILAYWPHYFHTIEVTEANRNTLHQLNNMLTATQDWVYVSTRSLTTGFVSNPSLHQVRDGVLWQLKGASSCEERRPYSSVTVLIPSLKFQKPKWSEEWRRRQHRWSMYTHACRPLGAEIGTRKLISGSSVIDRSRIQCQESNGIVV